MDELNYMLDNIEYQLGKGRKKTDYSNINYDYDNMLNMPLRNSSNLYLRNLEYSSLNNNNYMFRNNNDYLNNNYNNFNEKTNIKQLDKISNGAKDYELNLPYYQKLEYDNKIEKEFEPYSKNIQNDLNISLNNVKTELENIKSKEYDIDKLRNDLSNIKNKLSEYNDNINIIEKDNSQTRNILKNTSNDNKIKDENIINKYNELEKKKEEINKTISVIKDDQNKTGIQLKYSIANNNYEDVLSNLESQIEKLKIELENDANNKILKLFNNFNEKYNNDNDEIDLLKKKTKKIDEKINVINDNLEQLKEIPEIKNSVNELSNQVNYISNNFGGILNNYQNLNNNNEENEINTKIIEDKFEKIDQEINKHKKYINSFVGIYAKKEDIQDMENKLLVIQNDIKKLLEKYEESNNSINMENNNLTKLNKGMDNMISRNEFSQLINKKDNEYKNLKIRIIEKIDDIIKNYKNIINNLNENKKDNEI